jgi:transposase
MDSRQCLQGWHRERPLRPYRQEVAVMVCGTDASYNRQGHWLNPPWTTDAPAWQDIDQRLDANHLARQIRAFVLRLDLKELHQAYLGVGKRALPPELMLMVVLYEMHTGQLHPCHWAADCKFADPVKWLAMGLQPSPAYFYAFRKRLGPFVKLWHQQVVDRALAEGWTKGTEASIDGTFVSALGSRHRLVQAKTLAQRVEILRQALAADGRAARARTPAEAVHGGADPLVATTNAAVALGTDRTGAPSTEPAVAPGTNATVARPPYWLATTPAGRRRQLHRFRQAQQRLDELLKHHAQHETRKAKRKRRRPDQVRICPSEPEAALGRDKLKTCRPLYNVHLACDVRTPLILDYSVQATTTDAGLFIPTVQALRQTLGQEPESVLVDGIYATAANLAYCAERQVTMYAPVDDKPAAASADGSAAAAKKPRQLGKEQFRWDAAEQTYYCPEGHRLIQIGCQAEKREQDQEILVFQYRCPPQHCQACPQAAQCTTAPQKGRTIKRSEHEDKVEALRQRMHTPEGQALYKMRSQTIEPRIGDLKAHRGLRCFAGFGIALALIQVGLLVLVHNALCLMKPGSPPRQQADQQESSLQVPLPLVGAPPATPPAHAPGSLAPLPQAPT